MGFLPFIVHHQGTVAPWDRKLERIVNANKT